MQIRGDHPAEATADAQNVPLWVRQPRDDAGKVGTQVALGNLDVLAHRVGHALVRGALPARLLAHFVAGQRTLKPRLNFRSKRVLKIRIAVKAEPADETQDRRTAGLRAAGEPCDGFQPGHRVFAQQRMRHPPFGIGEFAQFAADTILQRLGLAVFRDGDVIGRHLRCHSARMPESRTAFGISGVSRSAHARWPIASPIRSCRISIST